MESSEYFRLQNDAIAEAKALTGQMESGEIAQQDAERRIIAVVQALERETAGYLPALQARLARRRRIIAGIAWLIMAVVLAALAYKALP